jgi:hypothetical protein
MEKKLIPIVSVEGTTDPLNTVCDLKWNYPIFNMQRGEFRSCCRTPSNKISEEELVTLGVDAFSNHPRELRERLDLVQGRRTKACQSCWNLEDSGINSPRHSTEQFNWFMKKQKVIEQGVDYSETMLRESLLTINSTDHVALRSKSPYMLEVNLGNTCDMKCMYCNHHYSTQWGAELIKHGDITQQQYDREFPKAPSSFDPKFWEWFNKTGRLTLNRVGVIGGEPLIMPEFYTFIEKIIQSIKPIQKIRKEKMTFWIVTNLNTPPKYLKKFLDYLPVLDEYFNVEILVSMESTGKRAEYIRNGLDWNKFEKNMDSLLSNRDLKFDFGFISSINALTIATTKEFVQWTEELYHRYGRPVSLKQNIISFPMWQKPLVLTPDFAKYIDDCIEYMETRVNDMPVVNDVHARWDSYIVFLRNLADSLRNNTKDETVDRKKFAEWFDTFDQRRQLNLVETFPEYREFYETCKQLN